MGKSVVVALPVFAKCDQARPRQVVALDRQSGQFPAPMPGFVGEVADHPVTD